MDEHGRAVDVDDLVDIHCHGAVGHELGQDGPGSRAAVAHHRDAGTRHVVASLVSAPSERLGRQVATLLPLVLDGTLAGLHLEGPFLAPTRCGAHDPAALRPPDADLVEGLVAMTAEAGAPRALRHLTFAPELPGAEALVRTCVRLGVRPAVGHTEADARVVADTLHLVADLQDSPALVTHLFNGMPPFHHRAGGPVAAALAAAARGEAVVELIADGAHVCADVVRMVFETVGPDAVALVSDATPATGLGDGPHRLGDRDVEVRGGVARLTGSDTVAGGTRTLAHCVRWAVEEAGVPLVDALRSARSTPARALALDPHGGGWIGG